MEKRAAFRSILAVLVLALIPVIQGAVASNAPERVTLEFMAPCPVAQVNDLDTVWEEVYKQTDDFLNVRVNYTFTGFDDIGQRISLRIAAGEQLDGAFVAQWTSPAMQDLINQGLLRNLDEYFHNDAYPGLKACFPEGYLASNIFPDVDGTKHVFAVPFGNFDGGNAVYYRKDLADKYGVPEIVDYDSLIAYFEAILANEPGMYPFTWIGTVDNMSLGFMASLYRDQPQYAPFNYAQVSVTGGHEVYVHVVVREDNTAYAARTFIPGLDPQWLDYWQSPFKDEEPLKQVYTAREWYEKGYFTQDILNVADFEGEFMAGKAASYVRGLNTYTGISERLANSIPGAELGTFIYNPNYRFDTVKAETSPFQVWNFMAIPVTSPNVDRVMGLLNWIFESQANHDLLELGIEGRHWIAIGDDKFALPPEANPETNYNFPGYILTWNPTIQRRSADLPDEIVKAMKQCGDPNNLVRAVESGFGFIQAPVELEVIQLNEVGAYFRALGNGAVADIEGEVERIQMMLDEAGYQTVIEEVERQFNEFLKENPYTP